VQLIAVGLKAVFGGVLVVAFSALSDVIQPKALALRSIGRRKAGRAAPG